MKSQKQLLILIFALLSLETKISAIDFKYDIPGPAFSSLDTVMYIGYGLNQHKYTDVTLSSEVWTTNPVWGFKESTTVTKSVFYESVQHQLSIGGTFYGHTAFHNFWLGLDIGMSFPMGYYEQKINGVTIEGNPMSMGMGFNFAQLAGYRIGPLRIFGLLGGAFELIGITSGGYSNITMNNSNYELSDIPSFNLYLYTGAGLALKLWKIVIRSDVQFPILKLNSHIQNQTIFSLYTGYAF